MKKIFALVLMATMLLALAACDGNAKLDKDMQDLIASQNGEESAPAPEAPSEEPAEEAGEDMPAFDAGAACGEPSGDACGEPSGEPSGEPLPPAPMPEVTEKP